MTQQFKFGDRVRWINNPGQFIYLDPDEHTPEASWIISEEGGQYLVDHIDLEPIPHPDTVRLDWLADLSNPANPIARVVPIEIYLGKRLNGLRDAIDAAMQIQAAETA